MSHFSLFTDSVNLGNVAYMSVVSLACFGGESNIFSQALELTLCTGHRLEL